MLQIGGNGGIRRRPVHLLTRRVTLCHVKSEKDAPPDDRFRKEGRWFVAEGFWLVPNMESVIYPALERFKFSNSRNRKSREQTVGKRSRTISRKQAEIRTRRIARDFKELVEESKALYMAQPQWSLRDFSVNSGEIVALLQEFMEFVEYAASYFEWTGRLPVLRTDLQKHGWKHITYDFIRELVDDKASLVPAPIQADLAGTPEQLMDLIRQAESRVPSSAARLEFLFPERDDLAYACEVTMSEKVPRARLDKIPTVGQLAAQWATEAVRNPDATEGQLARDRLQLLVSRGSVLRSSLDKGRPKVQVHQTAIKDIYEITYCLIKQIQEVKQFFAKYLSGDKEIEFHLWIFYPWLRDVIGKNVLSFVNGSTSDSAARLTGLMLGISPSKVQQTIYAD